MTNADKFKHLFGIYATELWAMPENDFLEWLNADAQDMPTADLKTGKWIPVTNGRGGHCCNRCNGYAPSYMNGDEHLSDYCPYCGSAMEAET